MPNSFGVNSFPVNVILVVTTAVVDVLIGYDRKKAEMYKKRVYSHHIA